jgi:glycosyltransferase involved in cell wall biosynthesis
MRILLVANTLPPVDVSGVGEQVLQLAAGLRQAGHEVEVLGRGPGQARGPKVLFPLTIVAPFVRRLRAFRPHVVQVHESDGALAALAAAVLGPTITPCPELVALLQVSYRREIAAVRALRVDGRLLGRPSASEWRFRWLKAPLQVVLGCFTAWLADRLLAPSHRTAEEIEADYGVAGVGVLPNATGGLDHGPALEAMEGEESSGYLLFVGRLRIRKGVEVLLDALRRLVERGRAPRLLVAGDGEHRQSLERTAARLGVAGHVRFLGRCAAPEVRRRLAGADALVVPSLYEGMPLVILEAMEARVPVVASAVSGIPEVVVDGETGWLVPAEDPVALAAALAEVTADPAGARQRGAAGRRRLDALYRPAVVTRQWLELAGRLDERAREGEEINGNG